MVPPAVERAILEILSPVVERSVTIACYTTVELLVKDFAMDPDEGRMRKVCGKCGKVWGVRRVLGVAAGEGLCHGNVQGVGEVWGVAHSAFSARARDILRLYTLQSVSTLSTTPTLLPQAAHLMVSTLAGSLALVTCKEPLRVQLTNTLKAQLQPPPNLSADVMESIIRCVRVEGRERCRGGRGGGIASSGCQGDAWSYPSSTLNSNSPPPAQLPDPGQPGPGLQCH